MKQDELVLKASAPNIARLRRLIDAGGGDQAFVVRVLAMAAKPPPPNLGDQHRLGGDTVLAAVHLSKKEAEEIRRRAEPLGFTRGGWMRALLRAHVRRQPQLPPAILKETTAVRYELQRIGNNLRQIARSLDEGQIHDQAGLVLAAWSEARRHLVALRATLAGNLLWWDGDHD